MLLPLPFACRVAAWVLQCSKLELLTEFEGAKK